MTKAQIIAFFSVFSLFFLWLHSMHSSEGEWVMLSVMIIGVLILLFPVAHVSKKTEEMLGYPEEETSGEAAEEDQPVLVYEGSSLQFPDDEIIKVLGKYFVYYTRLGGSDRQKFLERLHTFMSRKVFVIHDKSGFREMPVLISASAVQISFGLEKYLLPHFPHIHIFPAEFIGYYPTLRLLEGNVSSNCINLSWKHFFDGYKFPDNGQNVGLHEFAHAYYYQYFEAKENVEGGFVKNFSLFNEYGNKVYHQEQLPGNDFYSDYALVNFQEFWAESVELFFEKPQALKTTYPDLFNAIMEILNQDPTTVA